MCGLYGSIGATSDPRIIRCLAILNESRGKDATGFFNAHGAFWKHAERSTIELCDRKATKWIEDSCRKTWAVCGHCRASTRGGATTRNAHPFIYGKVIGSHNGVIPDSPKEYPVDTEWAIDLLSKADPGDYQGALGGVAGWYVLTWLDQRDKSIYLLNWEGSLNITLYNNVWYYSTEAGHLRTAIGCETKIAPIKQGDVLRFSWDRKAGRLLYKPMPTFTGKPRFTRTTQTTDYSQRTYRDEYDWRSERAAPRVLGPVQTTRRAAVVDTSLPSGYVIKFPNGLWYAHILNGKYRLMSSQEHMEAKFKDAKVDQTEWMRPGEIRSRLVPLGPANPLVSLAPNMKGPPDISSHLTPLIETSKGTQVAEKKSDQSKSDSAFPTEAEQERADLEAVKAATMDRDGKVTEEAADLQEERYNSLTDEYGLTHDEATRIMTMEGYFSPVLN